MTERQTGDYVRGSDRCCRFHNANCDEDVREACCMECPTYVGACGARPTPESVHACVLPVRHGGLHEYQANPSLTGSSEGSRV